VEKSKELNKLRGRGAFPTTTPHMLYVLNTIKAGEKL